MLIGRKMQSKELLRLYNSDRSEFVAVYGRRRVGKTYLVNEVLGDKILFRHAGLSRDDMEGQLEGWRSSLVGRSCNAERAWLRTLMLYSLRIMAN